MDTGYCWRRNNATDLECLRRARVLASGSPPCMPSRYLNEGRKAMVHVLASVRLEGDLTEWRKRPVSYLNFTTADDYWLAWIKLAQDWL